MYKQCIELVSAQGKIKSTIDHPLGNNHTKTFSVLSNTISKKHSYDQKSSYSGKNTQKSQYSQHSQSSNTDQLKRQFDAAVKGNIYHFSGHKMQWP